MKNRFSRLFVFSALLILIVFWLVGFLVFGGRSPRTGEYFKDTKNCEISPIWIFMIQGKSIALGARVFLAPIGYVGALVELMVNPVWDCVMMPVDMAKELIMSQSWGWDPWFKCASARQTGPIYLRVA